MTTHEEPLTVESLTRLLDSLGAAGHNLGGGFPDDIHLIEKRAEGWVVAYLERGQETSRRVWPTEAEACEDLLGSVTSRENNFFACVVPPALPEAADAAWAGWLAERGATEADLAAEEWKISDIPWREGVTARRYFVRRTAIRRLEGSTPARG
ncbi:hypothetical protein [Georgenia sp. Marseille-Q6866]